jgi:hypothetical protein
VGDRGVLQSPQNGLSGVDPVSLSPLRCGWRIHGCPASSRRTRLSSVPGSSSWSDLAVRRAAWRRSSNRFLGCSSRREPAGAVSCAA